LDYSSTKDLASILPNVFGSKFRIVKQRTTHGPNAKFACEVSIGCRIELDEIFNFATGQDEKNAEDFVKNARG